MIELPVLSDAEVHADTPRARFWRSVSHLNNDAEYQAATQGEFIPGASNAPSGTNRRQFIQLMGASMAMAGLSACRRPIETIVPYTRKPEEIIPGIPMEYASGMNYRGVLRPLVVVSHEGRPTKIEGNADHPGSYGTSGVFEQANILNLYDPDRSQEVLNDGAVSSWQAFSAAIGQLRVTGGLGQIAVLAAPSSSPTQARLKAEMLQAMPNTRWIEYRAEGDDVRAMGNQMAFGQPYRTHYTLENADVIVSLDADFLSPTAVDHELITRAFSDSRRVMSTGDTMSRLYVAESMYTATGAMADNRVRLRSSDIPAVAAAIAAKLAGGSTGTAFDSHPFVMGAAEDLQAAGSNGVVIAGETQSAEVHALAMALNSQLGAIGNTVVLLDTDADTMTPQADALGALVADMRSGAVGTVIMLGVNPVYSAPANLNLAEALRGVSTTIHVGLHVDETAQAVRWHVPMAHDLESWSDGRSYDGTLSVIQPLIAPLYDDAKSDLEVLNFMLTGRDSSGYDLVRATWRFPLGATDFENGWRKVLHDGYLPNTTYPQVIPAAGVVNANLAAGPAGLEVVFRLSPTVLDGSYANNAWMLELPDPSTKIVWDNVAIMSPATAEELGLESEYRKGQQYVDVANLNVNGQSVEIPIWVMPGHADSSITVHLGYGRNIASRRDIVEPIFFDTDHEINVYGQGSIGSGVGVNVAPMRNGFASVATGVQVSEAAEDYMIATTQDHAVLNVEKRPLYQMATVDEYRAEPLFAIANPETLPYGEPWDEYPTLWEDRAPAEGIPYRDNPYYQNQWGMTIDLNTCTGCNACVIACQSENNIQVVGKDQVSRGRETSWIRIDRYFVSDSYDLETDDPKMVFQPLPCQHCENAPCESVCPVAATYHSPDGTNQMVYNRCIGTRYCANNCPYKVRRFNFYNWTKDLPDTVRMQLNPNVTVRSRGVMEKCSFCIQRVRKAQQQASLEDRTLRDGDVVTACQQACPAGAITFGDMNDPNSAITRMKQNERRYELLPQINVKPRNSYMARITNPNAAAAAASEA
ncbi:MAG: TAT-variant-translocated molybdopterin oxidoreductase [Rhodothermales bacterium]